MTCDVCEVNGDGVVTQADIDLYIEKAKKAPEAQKIVDFCQQNCVGTTTQQKPVTIVPSDQAGNKALGDCASAQGAGVKDGITDLFDVEEFRKEISGESQATFCDYNQSGKVDLIDFSDYLRPGYIASN